MPGAQNHSISGRLVRNFTLTGGAVVFLAILLVGVVQYRFTDLEISAEAERYNEALTSALSVLLADEIDTVLAAAPASDAMAPANAPLLARLDLIFAKISQDTRVLKVKLFDTKGVVVYSTTAAEMGDTRYDNPAFRRALESHETASNRSFRESFKAVGGEVHNRYVLSSYLPVFTDLSQQNIRGVFEIYSDVTEPVKSLHWILGVEFMVATLLIGVAYTIQLLVVLRGAREIDRSHKERLELIALSDSRMKQMLEARAASNAKSTFLAMMSHELRTPLNAIIGFSQVMKDEILGPLENPKYKEYAAHIVDGGTHLLGIIDNVLALTKVEADAYRFSPAGINLADVLGEVVRLAQPLIEEKSLSLSVDIPPDLGAFADAIATKQVLVNLLGNAIKFTPRHGSIHVAGRTNAAGQIEIELRDSGCGIAPGDLDKVFEPFYQAGNPYHAEVSGTGLGLAISRTFARGMQGDLTISSVQGSGTVATLLLPAQPLAQSAAAQ